MDDNKRVMNAVAAIYSFAPKNTRIALCVLFSVTVVGVCESASGPEGFVSEQVAQCNGEYSAKVTTATVNLQAYHNCQQFSIQAATQYNGAQSAAILQAGQTVEAFNAGANATVQAPASGAQVAATGAGGGYTGCLATAQKASPFCATATLTQCKALADYLVKACADGSAQAGQTGANSGMLSKAGEALKGGGLLGPLLGAAAGGLLGYMMGSKDDASSSSESSEEPPELAPPPAETAAESSASSVASTASASSAGTGFETPAVVNIPTVDPNAEGGGGDSEILFAANDAIVLDDDGNVVDDSGSSSSTTLGGTSGGGSTGNTAGDESIVADAGDDSRNVEDVIVQDDQTALGLVGGSRGLASGAGFAFGASETSQGAVGGSGSGMMMGVPTTRARPRAGGIPAVGSAAGLTGAVRGTASNSGVTGSSAGMGAANPSATSGQGSSLAPFRTRDQIREDLRRRGLIQ